MPATLNFSEIMFQIRILLNVKYIKIENFLFFFFMTEKMQNKGP